MKRLLIIDDSAVVRKVAERILQDHALEVAHAESGVTGLAMCREFRPQYILLDSTLPDQTVTEFLAAIRERYGDAMPATMVMVNEVDIGPIMKAKRAGAAGFILKPFDRAHLIKAFAGILDGEEQHGATHAA